MCVGIFFALFIDHRYLPLFCLSSSFSAMILTLKLYGKVRSLTFFQSLGKRACFYLGS